MIPLERIVKKGLSSKCNYRVVAIGLNKKGEFIGIKTNLPRRGMNDMFRNSYHAEERLILSSPLSLKEVLIARLGKGGDFLPIDPCNTCMKLAEKRGIIIRSLV